MLVALIVLVLVGVAAGVVALFVRWEREGKEQLAPLVLLGLLVVEGTLYADPNMIRGLFHPGSGSTQLRLPEVYITLALLARLIVRGKPRRIGLPAGLWLAFVAWMLVGLLEGKLYHNPFSQDLYEAKDIIYIVGAMRSPQGYRSANTSTAATCSSSAGCVSCAPPSSISCRSAKSASPRRICRSFLCRVSGASAPRQRRSSSRSP